MSELLTSLFESLDPRRQQAMIAAATIYRSRTPGRVVYQSESDAIAHTEGYSMFPAVPDDIGSTPRVAGFFEAERMYQDRQDQRVEERAERIERGE